ncbi:MAG: MdtA/MuxA family multidrug efflux RND transporter periplasmic adaptor subunit [Burkholderiales bacterium]
MAHNLPAPAPTRTPRQRGRIGSLTVVLVLMALVLAAAAWWWRGNQARDVAGTPNAAGAAAPAGSASAPAAGKPGSGRRGPGADRPQPVSVGVVQRDNVREIVNAIGTITAFNTAVVRSQVAGPLKTIHFKEGQEVKAGQLLAEIDPRPFQAALAQAQGTLARDQAQFRNAQVDAKRYKDLLAKDSIASQQVDTQNALVRQFQGTVAVDQAAVDSAKLQLSYTKITAPISGRLGLRQVDAGNNVTPTDTNGIVSITQTRPISVTFAVPEARLSQITRQIGGIDAKGDPSKALPVEAWDREQKVKLATGHVTATDNAVDITTGTIKVKARFENDDNALFPNQFVNVRLQIGTLNNVLTVPGTAVQRGSVGTYVYKVQDDHTVAVRKVEPGVVDGDRVSVSGELAEGDQVVTDGADRLREGAKVEPIIPGAANVASNAQGAAQTAAGAQGAASPVADGQPAMMDRLSPDQAEKVKAMNPEERRAYFKKLREQRGPGAAASSGS